ncbi:MAG: CRTAC1 family protein [Gemmatimonadetes bacterium]|nr:CRTAC1 family protein [Gemmatimonadota bacterium]
MRTRRHPLRLSHLAFGLWLALPLCACNETPPPPTAPIQFSQVTAEAGIDFVHYNGFSGEYYYIETFGGGAAFFDYDNDGWLDLYLVNGTYIKGYPPDPLPVNKLYRNIGDGHFSDITAISNLADSQYGFGVSAADYDADGDQDLFIANYGPNTFYRNDGTAFSEIGATIGVDDPRWGSSAGFLDYDADGDLDLFVANYVHFSLTDNTVCKQGKVRSYCQPDVYEPTSDLLYRNDGTAFSNITAAAGIALKGRGLGVAFSDYDLDGDTDIYVANDGNMNFLYDNRQGYFSEVGLTAGTRYNEYGHADAGMGVDFGDYDSDGDQDLFVTNFTKETNNLYRNEGQGDFPLATSATGLAGPSLKPLGFGTRFFDYDLDADLDLFVANGHVVDQIAAADPEQTYYQSNQMFRNEDGTRFADISSELGTDFTAANVGRATAVADYDNDGDPDLLVTTVANAPRLLRNDGSNHRHWLLVELVGARHPDALGARVTVITGDRRQVRERQSGGSYLASHDPRLHFGLDTATRADIEIRWPDGMRQRLDDIAADQILRVVQPSP